MTVHAPAGAARSEPRPATGDRISLRWRWLLLAASVGAAYSYSLYTLWQQLGSQSPIAYLGLVPLLAAGLAWLRPFAGLRAPGHDPEFNLLLGLGFLVPAVLILALLPVQMGAAYWAYRLDLLSLPLFVAGAVAVLFGYDAVRACKLPILFTALCWPYPYYLLLTAPVQALTTATSSLAGLVAGGLGVGGLTPDPGVLSVMTPQGRLQLAVGVTCAGLTGILGFLLVGGAVALVVRGRTAGRLSWLAWGVGLSFAANLARIVALMALAHWAGPQIALGVAHPVLGMVLDVLTLVLMLSLLPLFGVQPPTPSRSAWQSLNPSRLHLAPVTALVLATLLAGLADLSLTGLSPTTDTGGQARLAAFSASARLPAGWSAGRVARYDWAAQYFGPDSTFDRYRLTGPHGQVVWADVVTTSNDSLNQYPVEGCLAFHGDAIQDIQKVSLGHSMAATALDYRQAGTSNRWSVVYWVWPVSMGGRTYQERMWLTTGPGDIQSTPDPSDGAVGTFDRSRVDAVNAVFRLSFGQGSLSPEGQDLVSFSRALSTELAQ